ncbi:alpha/beta-hydrolase [Marasmius fiardii PR-910]|nr:alpha/beta-hydrolase [Marasmius fiardii PR-910]
MIRSKSLPTLILLWSTFGRVLAQSTNFDWTAVSPTTDLSRWVECYGPYQCARLQVPLNYSSTDDGKTVVIAMIKVPANTTMTGPSQGPVFVNPGGPGVSGIQLIQLLGESLHGVIGQQFDVVSFDPRGVGFSSPKVTIFDSTAETNNFASGEIYDLNSTSTAMSKEWERYQLLGKLAVERDADGFLNHVSTDNVARDMLQMLEVMGQQKLRYWGFSYGTVLGAAFATMFPDRVGRLVIDGVVDMDGYFANDVKNQISDADKVIQIFFDECFAAGPQGCAFHASSRAEIATKLDALYEKVRVNPVKVSTGNTSTVVTYDMLRQVVFSTLSGPLGFPQLASALQELSEGDGTALAMQFITTSASTLTILEPYLAIGCGDATPQNAGPSELTAYMNTINSTFASLGIASMARCAGWKVHPESRFKGPVGGNTDYPLLVIGNTADPVTPLAAARKVNLAFPGSALLIQDSPGHSSLAVPSSCTNQVVAAYFASGTLPGEGTVCPVDVKLFPTTEASV